MQTNQVKIVNLTPHEVKIYTNGGVMIIPPSGIEARVEQIDVEVGSVEGIPLVFSTTKKVVNLPEPTKDTMYIVSGIVLDDNSVKNRRDLLAPATGPTHKAVRDSSNRICGVTMLRVNSSHMEQDCPCGSGYPISVCPDHPSI